MLFWSSWSSLLDLVHLRIVEVDTELYPGSVFKESWDHLLFGLVGFS